MMMMMMDDDDDGDDDDNLRDWPGIGMPGELLWAVYAPVGAKGNDEEDGDDAQEGC